MSSNPPPPADSNPPPLADDVSPTRRRAPVRQQVAWTTNTKLSLKTWTHDDILTEFRMDKNQWAILDAQVHPNSYLN